METEERADIVWVDAVALDDLWEGDHLGIEAAGEPVLLVRLVGGEVHAYQGFCPHQQVLLSDGDFDEEDALLTCSGHAWMFDLTTGEGVNPDRARLYRYPVRVDGDRVMVGVPADGQPHCFRAG